MTDLYNTPLSELPKNIAPELPEPEPVAYAEKVKEPETPYFVGFSVGLAAWGDFLDDLTDEEAGKLLRALLAYCKTGQRRSFEDRAIRLFYRQQCDAVDEQVARFQDKIKRMR